MPGWLTPILGALAGFLKWLGSLLVPYLLGRSHARENATEAAIERLDNAGDAIDRVRNDPDELERLRSEFRRRQ